MFEKAERETNVVPSVALLHKRNPDVSPLHHADDPLGHPRLTGIPAPQSAFVKEWMRQAKRSGTATESTVADLFVFENATLARKLEVFVWTIEYVKHDLSSLHYAFLLHVEDM